MITCISKVRFFGLTYFVVKCKTYSNVTIVFPDVLPNGKYVTWEERLGYENCHQDFLCT